MINNLMKQEQVPILVTWDVDPDIHIAYEARARSFDATIDLCHDLGIQSTFFITANADHISPQHVERMLGNGQEVGCHGLTHGGEEDYDRMSAATQRTYIEEATHKLERLVGGPILSFRSPRVKTSAQTLRLLSEYGYLSDSSVCSQRVDFVSSNLINKGWIFAPRRSYHPHRDDAFKRGDLPIWEIPVSAMVVPFISTSLRVLGLTFMKAFFRLLHAESSRCNGKPIVYLTHPTEFTGGKPQRRIKRKYFSPSYIRTHGFIARHWLCRMDGATCLKATRELLGYMASFPDVTFMTVNQYVTQHLNAHLPL